MATFYVTEFSRSAHDGVGVAIPAGLEPSHRTQTITIAGTSAQAAEMITRRFVRVHAEAACHYKVSTDPTATTSDTKMAAGQTEFFGIVPGMKIAVIAGA